MLRRDPFGQLCVCLSGRVGYVIAAAAVCRMSHRRRTAGPVCIGIEPMVPVLVSSRRTNVSYFREFSE